MKIFNRRIFKTRTEKEDEQKAELLQFLRSDEARQTLFELLVDARLQGDVQSAIATAKQQLLHHVHAEARQIHQQISAEIAHERAEAPRRAAEIRRELKESLSQHEQEIVELTRASTKKAIEEVLVAYLHELLRQEVKSFIRTHPIGSGLSNRQLSAANGISIREVKRRRRRGCY